MFHAELIGAFGIIPFAGIAGTGAAGNPFSSVAIEPSVRTAGR